MMSGERMGQRAFGRAPVLNRRGLLWAGLSIMIPMHIPAAASVGRCEGETSTPAQESTRAVLQLSENMTAATLAAQAQTRRFILHLASIFAKRELQTGYVVFLKPRGRRKALA